MPRGGKRPGAGRKVGSLTKKTRDIAEAAAAAGETPLEYMLRVMRDPTVDDDKRSDMAKAAAPYVHARLASTHVTADADAVPSVVIFKTTYEDDARGIPPTPYIPRDYSRRD
jgi:hypothetical protein